MAATGNPTGPVILFTHEGISYEYLQSLGVGPHGESLLLARKRTSNNILEDVVVRCLGLPPGEPTPALTRARARMEEEARLAAYLRHPCLARVLCHQQTEHALYTALEYVRGPTLDELVGLALERGKPFSEALILYVGAELASALAHVHTREDEHGHPLGIVHRNLSTETIRLTWRGGVRLADFGLAHSQLPGRRPTSRGRPRGPLFFSAPETLLEQKVEARSDLFSVGLVLLELATGRHLYDPAHKTDREIRESLPAPERRQVARVVDAALSAGNDESAETAIWGAATYTRTDVERAVAPLSSSLRSIVMQLLRRAPAERMQTAAELEEALRTRLEVVGPYDGHAAVAEIHGALADASEALVSHDLGPGLLAPSPSQARSAEQHSTR